MRCAKIHLMISFLGTDYTDRYGFILSFFREIRVIPCLKEILKLHPTPVPKH